MVARWLRRAAAVLGGVLLVVLVLAGAYAGRVVLATKFALSHDDGTIAHLRLDGAVTIARDARGVPHIRAGTDHDLFFAEGYAVATDRLFQMDLTRRFVLGRLAEVLGTPLVPADRRMRGYGVAEIAQAMYRAEPPRVRAALEAYADGVNAAAATQPLPPEYHALFVGWWPWRPQDAIAVGLAIVLDLDDDARAIVARDWIHRHLGSAGTDAFLPLTDPAYDVPVDDDPPGPLPSLPPLPGPTPLGSVTAIDERDPLGSNAWAAGAGRTTNGRAILANDPHLGLRIPAVWWLVEMRSPGYHVAGATFPGTPGVTLGHDEHVAWGVTAAETAAMRLIREPIRAGDELFEDGRWIRARHRREHIVVRFGHPVDEDVLESPHGTIIGRDGAFALLRDWRLVHDPRSPLDVFLALDRARSVEEGLAAFRALPEPALNVVLIDDRGRATFHLAGGVPVDDVAGRWAVEGADAEPPLLAFDRAPRIAPSRDALIVSSNNRDDGARAPRLAPYWQAPYRAYELRRALAAAGRGGKLSPETFGALQRDLASPAELELARRVLASALRRGGERDRPLAPVIAALRSFDGRVEAQSRGATVVSVLRVDLLNALAQMHMPPGVAARYVRESGTLVVPLRALRERPRGWVPGDDWDAFVVASLRRVARIVGEPIPPFGRYGAQPLDHPLAPFGFRLWNGPALEGRGGRYAPSVQWRGHGQSFRAVWSAGAWDTGTIEIDAGESGRPGSPHYADQNRAWAAGTALTLPFSDEAVRRATATQLTLRP